MKKRKRHSKGQLVLKFFILLLCILCVLPTWLVIASSFTNEQELASDGFKLLPREWSLEGYHYILSFSEQIIQSYKITLFTVVAGTVLSLLVISMAAYAISRPDYVLKPYVSFFFLFSMLMNGGLLATYIVMTNVWHMRNNLLVYILPGAFSAMNCFVMRSFISGNVPADLIEAARIDGAGDWRIYWQMLLPLMKPVLAAIGFMTAVGLWNDWGIGYLYINQAKKMTLQLLLMRLESNLTYLQANVQTLSSDQLELLNKTPVNSGRMAMLVSTIVPIMIVYPFFQKYFIKGIMLGSMKG